ncbi:TonB-dependent receptor plug domain-containing protein [Breznakibacter xylanolyticus]|nr:TonB-dependent receptor [Breznakibacter xylanolyticus]
MKKLIISCLILVMGISQLTAQEKTSLNVNTMTRNDVMNLTIDDLSSLPIEDLMKVIEIAGVSSADELYAMLNKNLSSASKKTESQLESPLSTTVISHQELIASGATCIEEALRMVPGVIVRQKTNGNFDVHLRGNDNLPTNNMLIYSENTKTLVMVNGRPVFNYAFGGIMWETLPVNFDEIDRIEVVRGPASALYGPNAVSGAINIITKSTQNATNLVNGNFQGGTRLMNGSLGLQKAINNKMSFGINGNFEKRTRDDEKIYLFPTSIGDQIFEGGYFTTDEYDKVQIGQTGINLKDKNDKITDLFEDINIARRTAGVNGQFEYAPTANTNINFTTGFQDSYANTSTMGDPATSMGGRKSTTGYADITAQLHHLMLKANGTMGKQDFATGDEGFQVDMQQMNLTAEYDWQYKSLTVRPGINYQYVSYNDEDYLTTLGTGYFNGKKEMNTLAGSVRFDYVMFDRLRLIAALRAEKYDKPDKWTGSWQFVGSYSLTGNQTVRAVYSRANQSAFMINTESNYLWEITNRPFPDKILFGGNDSYNLMQMDMFEIGYRVKPSKTVMIDVEGYYNISKNFGALMPQQTSIVNLGSTDSPIIIPYYVAINYRNFDLEATQLGASVNVNWIVSPKLMVKGHINWQETKLDNYLAVSRDYVIGYQTMAAAMSNSGSSDAYPTELQNNVTYKYTPAIYGNLGIDYRPCEKVQLYADANYIDKQTFANQYGTVELDAKVLVNLKATYKFNNHVSVFANGRNLLNNTDREFGYMDQIGAMYLGGLNVKF